MFYYFFSDGKITVTLFPEKTERRGDRVPKLRPCCKKNCEMHVKARVNASKKKPEKIDVLRQNVQCVRGVLSLTLGFSITVKKLQIRPKEEQNVKKISILRVGVTSPFSSPKQ